MKLRITITAVVAITVVASWAIWSEWQISRGQRAFAAAGCAQCHLAGGAPGLQNVAAKFDRQTLARFIRNPEDIYRERGVRVLNEGYMPMPKVDVSAADSKAIATFLMSQSR